MHIIIINLKLRPEFDETMKRFLWITLCLCMAFAVLAQKQQGIVRTIGRPGQPGAPVANVTIRWQGMFNAVISNANGQFTVTMPGKKNGDEIVLQSVSKNGYELKDKGVIGRPQVFSTTVPIEIVMVNLAQLQADKKRIEDKAYKVAEKNYNKKLKQFEKKVKKKKISEEQYRQELKRLQKQYEAYLSLIGDMADRYARTDYDQLDSIDYQINLCIENGELEKADSLIHTVFDPETVLDRNRAAKEEIRQRIEFAQKVIDKANADKAAILRDFDYAERVIALSENLVTVYISQGEREKAINCLQKSLEIAIILHGKDSNEAKTMRQRIQAIQQ